MASGDAPRITGLNSFGQPFRGNKIRGVGAEERAVGRAYSREMANGHNTGSLATRGDGSQGNFAARKIGEAQDAERAANERRAQEAVARGRTQAQTATGTAPVPKRQGQLVETGLGRSIWKSGDELARAEARKGTSPAPKLNEMEAKTRKARREARRSMGRTTKKPSTFKSDLGDEANARIRSMGREPSIRPLTYAPMERVA